MRKFIFELSIKTRPPCLNGLEKKHMTSLLLAVSYRLVPSVLAELLCISRVCHPYDSDSFCHINTVLLIVNYKCLLNDAKINPGFLQSDSTPVTHL